jgi:hypothetical protein
LSDDRLRSRRLFLKLIPRRWKGGLLLGPEPRLLEGSPDRRWELRFGLAQFGKPPAEIGLHQVEAANGDLDRDIGRFGDLRCCRVGVVGLHRRLRQRLPPLERKG